MICKSQLLNRVTPNLNEEGSTLKRSMRNVSKSASKRKENIRGLDTAKQTNLELRYDASAILNGQHWSA
eukprot:9533033-Ditylum_brightwellii.AAC.1